MFKKNLSRGITGISIWQINGLGTPLRKTNYVANGYTGANHCNIVPCTLPEINGVFNLTLRPWSKLERGLIEQLWLTSSPRVDFLKIKHSQFISKPPDLFHTEREYTSFHREMIVSSRTYNNVSNLSLVVRTVDITLHTKELQALISGDHWCCCTDAVVFWHSSWRRN